MIRMAVRGSGWGAPRWRSLPGARGEVCMVEMKAVRRKLGSGRFLLVWQGFC